VPTSSPQLVCSNIRVASSVRVQPPSYSHSSYRFLTGLTSRGFAPAALSLAVPLASVFTRLLSNFGLCAFAENEIVGEALVALLHDDLKSMGVTSVGHRLTILKSVYDVKKAQDIPIESDHYVPLCMCLTTSTPNPSRLVLAS